MKFFINQIPWITLFVVSLNFPLSSAAPQPEKGIQLEKEVFSVGDSPAFVIMPEKADKTKQVPWVWFAPTIDIVPTENDTLTIHISVPANSTATVYIHGINIQKSSQTARRSRRRAFF